MSEERQKTIESGNPGMSLGKQAMFGCGSLVLALLVFGGLYVMALKKEAEAISNGCRKAIIAVRAQDRSRPVLFGPAVKGNAVPHYQVLEWALGPRDEWKTKPPEGLPKTSLSFNQFKDFKPGLMLASAYLISDINSKPEDAAGWYEVADQDAPSAPETSKADMQAAIGFFKDFGEVIIGHVREGLRREECDWQFQYEQGAEAKIPNLITYRTVANLMAVSAHKDKDASRGLRTSLELMAWTNDVGRQPTLITGMIATAMRSIALMSIERMLRRPLTRAALQQALDTLKACGPMAVKPMFEGEKLWVHSEIARTLRGESTLGPQAASVSDRMANHWILSVWTWRVYDKYMDRSIAALDKPYSVCQQELAAADKTIEDHWNPAVRGMCSNVIQGVHHVLECNILYDLCLLGVAARLHALDQGQWPKSTEALSKYFKSLPQDRYEDGKKPYQLKLKEDGQLLIRCREAPHKGLRSLGLRISLGKN